MSEGGRGAGGWGRGTVQLGKGGGMERGEKFAQELRRQSVTKTTSIV